MGSAVSKFASVASAIGASAVGPRVADFCPARAVFKPFARLGTVKASTSAFDESRCQLTVIATAITPALAYEACWDEGVGARLASWDAAGTLKTQTDALLQMAASCRQGRLELARQKARWEAARPEIEQIIADNDALCKAVAISAAQDDAFSASIADRLAANALRRQRLEHVLAERAAQHKLDLEQLDLEGRSLAGVNAAHTDIKLTCVASCRACADDRRLLQTRGPPSRFLPSRLPLPPRSMRSSDRPRHGRPTRCPIRIHVRPARRP